jgi:hypothetical protein
LATESAVCAAPALSTPATVARREFNHWQAADTLFLASEAGNMAPTAADHRVIRLCQMLAALAPDSDIVSLAAQKPRWAKTMLIASSI